MLAMSSFSRRRSGRHKAAQQSVHPTCGSRRDLQAFFWLRFFSTSQAFSQPAHTRVTQTVGRLSRQRVYFQKGGYI
jgi:hypothetical protein